MLDAIQIFATMLYFLFFRAVPYGVRLVFLG